MAGAPNTTASDEKTEAGKREAPVKKEKKQKRPFKKKRAGVTLTKNEVREIKKGRKKLRREMRSRGVKSKREFELVAGSLGLYFDKRSGLLLWLFHGKGLWALLGALLLLFGGFFLMSLVSQMRGYFTVNLSGGMFKEGFTLSPTVGFENPSVNLMCEPANDLLCISYSQLDEDVDETDGQHNTDYFAYTFYCRNEGESTVDYTWELELVDESKSLSDAAWVMIFEDGRMSFYAKASALTGGEEAIPAFGDDSRGYMNPPLMAQAKDPARQYPVIAEKNGVTYYRLVPYPFISGDTVAGGLQESVEPMEVHKYTVVIWIEGDDPDATNELIGGHLGLAMQFRLADEEESEGSSWWANAWDNLTWWN